MPDSVAANSILANLNEPQRQAVSHRDGPLLVLAGPGSGKTRVITRRAAMLVHTGVRPRNILAITFTNKAADEMRRRIDALGVASGMWIHTFHALGARLLREFGPIAGVQPGYTIYDDADQKRVIKEAMRICDVSTTLTNPDAIASRISRAKNRLERAADLTSSADFFDERIASRVYEAYEQLMRQRNAVDFDDLLMRVAIVLRDNPDLAETLNRRFQYLLIDEYQDTNYAQYLIARHLSQFHQNICATGDPDQSIYGWRGADIRNILEFERDYPDAVVVRLEQNYRSTPAILRAASQLIRCNAHRKHKDLWTELPEAGPVHVRRFAEGRDEAEHIAETIAAMHEDGRAYGDFAICYRINAISRGLEEALRARMIPYKIARGLEFYNRREIRDMLAYLRLLVNPADDVAFERVVNTPARKIGKTSIDRLRNAAQHEGIPLLAMAARADEVPALKSAAKRLQSFATLIGGLTRDAEGPVDQIAAEVLERSGLEDMLEREDRETHEDRLANVQELVSAAARYEDETENATLEEFLQRIALVSDQDQVDESAGVVMLMTLHAAKGLEFPVVFIAGLEQGMLPHERSIQAESMALAMGRTADGRQIEEERRLFFVGITRAMQELFVTHADERYMRGALTARAKSQFLHELPDDAVVFEEIGAKIRQNFGQPNADGFVPMDDHLSPEEFAARGQRRRRSIGNEFDDEPVFSPNDPTGSAILRQKDSAYKDWAAGTIVQHEKLGVGQVIWIKPGPRSDQTRAAIHFARHGEKTFILENAPIVRVSR